ncbi:MAG TPA: phosphoenolpyruvate carboxykinase (ATP), partial [Chthonomonadaceae bacterium]|nr:phosphoenolpyruvate carboxykinase (ATP) [Chthonomonadaceae bacterium]
MAHLKVESNPADLAAEELTAGGRIAAGLPAAVLIEHALRRGEGALADNGALAVETGKFTGRSPRDKFIVEEPSSQAGIWWGPVNQPLSEESFDRLYRRITGYLRDKDLYAQDLYGGADARYSLPVRILTEYAWHSLFARQLLVRPDLLQRAEAQEGVRAATRDGFTML